MCGARLPMHLSYWTVQSVVPDFYECGIADRRSVAVQWMLYKISCSMVHPLNGALPGPYVPVRVTRVLWSHIGTLMRRLTAEPRNTAGLISVTVSLWIDLANPVFDGVGLAGFKSRANASLLAKAALSLL